MKRVASKSKPAPTDDWKNYAVKERPELPTWVQFGTIMATGFAAVRFYKVVNP